MTSDLTKQQHAFILHTLRKASLRSPERTATLTKACVGRKVNINTGRMANHYECACCKQEFPASEVQVDHIIPIVPVTGFDTWDGLITRLLTGEQQVLCKPCHKEKSLHENRLRKEFKKGE